jgi:hypothetical protein
MKRNVRVFYLLALLSLLLVGCVNTAETTTTTTLTTSQSTATTETTTTTTTTATTTTTTTATTTTTTTLPSYVVAFEANGGSPVSSQSIVSGQLVSPVVSTREDYVVLDWYVDQNLTDVWDFATDVVTGPITLYAKWDFTYTLSGSGQESDPFLIQTLKDLEVVRDGRFFSSSIPRLEIELMFQLQADLILETDFTDIDGIGFFGIFDGNGHTITITGDSGLFFLNRGTIVNLIIDGDIETDLVDSLGLFAHYNEGLIENVQAIGVGVRSTVGAVGVFTLDGTGGAGAIAGTNEASGIIRNVSSNVNVQATMGGGGIVGFNAGTITLASHFGTVGEATVLYISLAEQAVGKFSYLGGIAGINIGLISQSQNRGRVFAQRAGNTLEVETNGNRVLGGIAGYNGPTGIVTETYNAYGTAGPSVHGDRIIGGIVGHNFGMVSFSYSPANIGGRANIGGIVGLMDESVGSVAKVTNCWTNSNFNSGANEEDEIGAYLVADVSNWYNLAKFADYSYYHGTRGLPPVGGEGNLSGASVSLDMTALLNTGLAIGEEKFVITNGSSSGNAKTKLGWQKVTATFIVDGVETEILVLMGNTPNFGEAPEKNGYIFLEWRQDVADPVTVWTPVGITANITVAAVFEVATYAIDYVLDGGTNDAGNPIVYTILTPTITLLPATRPGCAFLGWFVGDTLVETIDLGSFGDQTLTAKWEITAPYLTVHFADTSLPDQTLIDIPGSSLTLAVVEKAGFEFLGWSLDGTTVLFNGNQVLAYADLTAHVVEGVVTLVPVFEQIFNYTITFNANGGVGTMAEQTLVVGDAYPLPINTFTAANYTFYGWLFNGLIYNDGAEVLDLVTSGLNAELTALWKSNESNVPNGTFDLGGVLTSTDAKTYSSDVWNVYRNNSTNVTALAGEIANGQLTITATIAATATSLNFYIVVPITLPGLAVGSRYQVSFTASVSDPNYNFIGAYIRSRAVGSTTYRNVTNLATFDTIDTATTTFTALLNATDNIVEGNTYFLLIPLAYVSNGIAGTYTWVIDNVLLNRIGAAE